MGLEARDASGAPIGKVDDVIEYPMRRLPGRRVARTASREVPNIERYVLEVDVPGGFVRVDHLDELDPIKHPKGALMRFEVITIFPELFESFLQKGLVGQGARGGVIQVTCTNPRDFASNKHKSVDDAPYGGGSGMVMMPGPILEAIESRETDGQRAPHPAHAPGQALRSGHGAQAGHATRRSRSCAAATRASTSACATLWTSRSRSATS